MPEKKRVNLIETWIAAEEAEGKTIADLVDEINHEFGLAIDKSRVSNWRHGRVRPSADVVAYMIAVAIPHLVPKDNRALRKRLLASLSLPESAS